ncbi:hypothetical protein ACIBEA_39670 [Streptomyces sp. NPDC051555]|uniref:hypothetical protein n=1 Tax=Streptomyces sp. NPDC051555 TaxID=3365657 RepID=UPI0037B90778
MTTPTAPAPQASADVGQFTETSLAVLRLLGEGHTVDKAARILGIRHAQASNVLSEAYKRTFGAPLGKGYASVRTQFLKLLDYAYSSGALTPTPVTAVDLGDLPREILRLVVDGRTAQEIAELLDRGEAEVRAGTRRLRVAAGMDPNESWNRIVNWGHGSGNLTASAGVSADTAAAASRPTSGTEGPR